MYEPARNGRGEGEQGHAVLVKLVNTESVHARESST